MTDQTLIETFDTELIRAPLKQAMKEAGASSADLWKVDPRVIKVLPGFNPRIANKDHEENILALMQMIRENGFMADKPLAGFTAIENDVNVIYVTDGHRRLEAVMRLIAEGHNIETVPVVVKSNGTSMEDLSYALYTSNTGQSFTPYETGLLVKRLLGMGASEATVAKRMALTEGYVKKLLLLLEAPKVVRDLVASGQVSAGVAIEQLQKNPVKAADVLSGAVAKAKEGGKKKATRRDVAASGPAQKGVGIDTVFDLRDQYLQPMSSDLVIAFTTEILKAVGAVIFNEEETPNETGT